MSPRLIQSRLNEHARRLGLPIHVHPHVLRHSFASHLLQSSGDLRAVQELLGHASIASTQIYTALDFQHLASVYDATHPRAHKKKDHPVNDIRTPPDVIACNRLDFRTLRKHTFTGYRYRVP